MSLTTAAIVQGADQNLFAGITPSSTVVPLTSYSLAEFTFLRPDWRVKFGSGTLTLTWDLGSPGGQGDIFVLPMSNLVDGHVTLTNTSGLSQNIPVPATLRNGIPKTIVVDLSVLTPSSVTRTAGTWSLVISGNPSHVTLGACIALYSPKTALGDRDFRWAYTTRKVGATSEKTNEYLTRFILNMQTMERSIDLTAFATDADADVLEAWFDANNGRGLPGLLWLTPEIEDAFFGILQATFERVVGSEMVPDTNLIKITCTELSKGLPLL